MIITLILIIVFVSAIEFTNQRSYGEFKNKFKNTWDCKIFILFTFIYRMILGFYCAV